MWRTRRRSASCTKGCRSAGRRLLHFLPVSSKSYTLFWFRSCLFWRLPPLGRCLGASMISLSIWTLSFFTVISRAWFKFRVVINFKLRVFTQWTSMLFLSKKNRVNARIKPLSRWRVVLNYIKSSGQSSSHRLHLLDLQHQAFSFSKLMIIKGWSSLIHKSAM